VSSSARAYTQSLLLAAYRQTANELLDALRAAGHERIRHKHGAVFANLDPDGTRPSVLADRARMTRGAMGELIDELERLGYVRRTPDPADRRAKLIVATDAAREVTAVVVRVNEAIERRYRRELGTESYQTLRTALERLAGDKALVQPRIRT
jgi:DNA-binding MarR family transcriptional regulator